MIRKKKSLLPNNVELHRQKQMLSLMSRYSKRIEDPNSWTLPYSWNIGYIDHLCPGAAAGGIQYEEFFCNTNNVVFAAMIFEAQKITEGKVVSICYIEFNQLINLS